MLIAFILLYDGLCPLTCNHSCQLRDASYSNVYKHLGPPQAIQLVPFCQIFFECILKVSLVSLLIYACLTNTQLHLLPKCFEYLCNICINLMRMNLDNDSPNWFLVFYFWLFYLNTLLDLWMDTTDPGNNYIVFVFKFFSLVRMDHIISPCMHSSSYYCLTPFVFWCFNPFSSPLPYCLQSWKS
jgi:hypothetical protein